MSDGFSWKKVSSGGYGGKGQHTRGFEIRLLVFAEDLCTWVGPQLPLFPTAALGSPANRL